MLTRCLIVLCVSGCGALSLPSNVDAGTHAEGARDASVGGAGSDSGTVDGGEAPDGGSFVRDAGEVPTVDAGGVAPADAGALPTADSGMNGVDAGAWLALNVSLPATQGNTVLGLSGRAGEIYAVTDYELFRSSGGGFGHVPLTSLGAGYPSMNSVSVAPDGAVFVLAQKELFTCRTGCAAGGAAFTSFLPSSTDDGVALCGQSSSLVYAVFVNRSTSGNSSLRKYDGTGWAVVATDLNLDEPRRCAVTASGAVAITGRGGVVVFDQGTGVLNHPDDGVLPSGDSTTMNWYGIAAVGEELWAGGVFLRSSHRSAGGSWAFINDTASAIFFGISAASTTEVYAVGGQGKVLKHFEGSAWSVVQASGNVQLGRSVFVVSPTLIYVGGSNGNTPAIDRFTRP